MLKIKDDVDLKELEKFGFRKSNEEDRFALPGCSNCYVITDGIIGITVTYKERDIRFIFYNEEYLWEDVTEIDLEVILYNLIQAGLVEKIEEE